MPLCQGDRLEWVPSIVTQEAFLAIHKLFESNFVENFALTYWTLDLVGAKFPLPVC